MKKLILAVAALSTLAAVPAHSRDAAELFGKYCTVCHTAGVANAPKAFDAAAWKPRLDKGEAALLTSINNGLNAMPPKGMCPDCTPDEYKALIKYMSTAK